MSGHVTKTVAERFWPKVDKSGGSDACWPWRRARNEYGYGLLRVQGRNIRATRLALELSGHAVPNGAQVCHRCDNPPCCNPAHLFVGDAKANSADAVAKGRIRSWSRHGMAKLSDGDVLAIRREHASGVTLRDLAIRFVVSPSHLSLVVRGVLWPHLPGAVPSRRAHHPKLTAEQVVSIRERVSRGERRREIAASHGITESNVSRIVGGRR